MSTEVARLEEVLKETMEHCRVWGGPSCIEKLQGVGPPTCIEAFLVNGFPPGIGTREDLLLLAIYQPEAEKILAGLLGLA